MMIWKKNRAILIFVALPGEVPQESMTILCIQDTLIGGSKRTSG